MSNRELLAEASLYANDDGIMGMPKSPNATFCDMICRLAAALAAHEWQPIETAPRDGTWLLLWCDWPFVGKWADKGKRASGNWTEDADSINPIYGATHWQPLPDPPKDAAP